MLAKQYRLSAREVERVMRSGKTARAATLRAKWLPDTGLKVAIVAPKKLRLGAVGRNRFRRKGYAAARTLLARPAPLHIVFFFDERSAGASVAELAAEMAALAHKMKNGVQ